MDIAVQEVQASSCRRESSARVLRPEAGGVSRVGRLVPGGQEVRQVKGVSSGRLPPQASSSQEVTRTSLQGMRWSQGRARSQEVSGQTWRFTDTPL